MRISDWSSDVCSSDLVVGNIICRVDRQREGEQSADGAAPRPVVAFVDGNARHPDPERTCSVIARQRREGRDETLLGDVERGIGVADMSPNQPVHGLAVARSEEHTSELQSLMRISYAVFCL